MPQTTNRTYWPVSGGALSVQPGWFPGHAKAFIYVNIGIQQEGQLAPPNMSHPVVPPFEITGPTNQEYPGQFCLPQIGMPANVSLVVGQNITLQVVELAVHGAALYSVSAPKVAASLFAPADRYQCVDLTLVEDGSDLVTPVSQDNCYNSSDMGFQLVFTTAALASDAVSTLQRPSSLLALLACLIVSAAMALL